MKPSAMILAGVVAAAGLVPTVASAQVCQQEGPSFCPCEPRSVTFMGYLTSGQEETFDLGLAPCEEVVATATVTPTSSYLGASIQIGFVNASGGHLAEYSFAANDTQTRELAGRAMLQDSCNPARFALRSNVFDFSYSVTLVIAPRRDAGGRPYNVAGTSTAAPYPLAGPGTVAGSVCPGGAHTYSFTLAPAAELALDGYFAGDPRIGAAVSVELFDQQQSLVQTLTHLAAYGEVPWSARWINTTGRTQTFTLKTSSDMFELLDYQLAIGGLPPPDDDGDGITDGDDNCAAAANADQADLDGDGAGDACDDDDDGDGWPDVLDGCPLVPDPFQLDGDGDGLGDACDAVDDGGNDADADGDGVQDDVCPATPAGAVVEPSTGCSLAELCPCEAPRGQLVPWRNHGQYLACVARSTGSFVAAGLVAAADQGPIVAAAATSTCGAR